MADDGLLDVAAKSASFNVLLQVRRGYWGNKTLSYSASTAGFAQTQLVCVERIRVALCKG